MFKGVLYCINNGATNETLLLHELGRNIIKIKDFTQILHDAYLYRLYTEEDADCFQDFIELLMTNVTDLQNHFDKFTEKIFAENI